MRSGKVRKVLCDIVVDGREYIQCKKVVRYFGRDPVVRAPYGFRRGRTWYGRRWVDVVIDMTYSVK